MIAWLLAGRPREIRGTPQPSHAIDSDAPRLAEGETHPLAVEAPELRSQVDDADSAPNPPQPTKQQKKKVDVLLWPLSNRLQEFDAHRSFDTASALLQSCIQVEWDANGKFEDVTNKWDTIDPSNGHQLLKLPKYDPKQEGFLDILDPRGSRWYRFTPQDFPEWWQLNYPDPASETGKQEGFAMPRRVADDLASAIRTRATGLLERFKDQ